MSGFNLFVYGTLRGAGTHAVDGNDRAPDAPGALGALGPDNPREPATTGSAATPSLMAGCTRIAEGTIGGTLYDVERRFPALVYYGSDPVRGEIWRCPAAALLALDEYEGTASGLFRRIAVEIETNSGHLLPCWVYTAGPALSRHLTPANRIASGDWQAHAS